MNLSKVQEAVARCLTPLVPAVKADAPEIVKKLLLVLLGSENYGERKGLSLLCRLVWVTLNRSVN